jgi:phage baseplate assembly protein W
MSIEKRYNPIDLLPDVAVGVKLPFVTKEGNLFQLSYSTEEQAISNLKNLILTRRGERILQPLFGTNLRDSLFEQNDNLLKESIETNIIEAVEFWLPYISITELNVQTVLAVDGTNEEHGVTISLKVSVNDSPSEIPVTFLVTAGGVEEV